MMGFLQKYSTAKIPKNVWQDTKYASALALLTQTYSELCQTSKMEHFAKTVNGF